MREKRLLHRQAFVHRQRKIRVKTAVCKPKKEAAKETSYADALILDF